jgi:hypothetical protein
MATTAYHEQPAIASALDVMLAARLDRRLNGTRAHVLHQVAIYASGCAGACWAAVETIAAAAHVAANTARRALHELVALGWLVAIREVGRSVVYRVNVAQVSDPRRSVVEAVEVDRQLGLAYGGGLPLREGGAPAPGADQNTDQTILAPPLAPPAGGDGANRCAVELPDDPFELLEVLERLEQQAAREVEPVVDAGAPLPLDRGHSARVEWVARRALGELGDVSDPEHLELTLERYRTGDGGLVDVYATWSRPQRARGTVIRTWADAPDGLRRREIRAGLRLARERWLAQGAR